MKTNLFAVVSTLNLALALLVSLAGLTARAAVFDDFESYAVGSNLHGQGGWSGWAGDPGAGAVVSSTFSFSTNRSVNVTGATDLVHTFSGVTNGQWVFKVMQYIPATSSGTNYVVLLNRYRPPFGATDLNWSVQIQNNMNTGQIISDLGGGASRPMVKNQWVEIRVEINLASNTVAEFYNGQPLSTHVWQDGSGLNEMQALDLFANDSGPVYYDNVSLAPAPPADAPPTLLRISNTGPNLEGLPTFKLEWEAIPNATYLVQSADSLAPGSLWTTLDAVIMPDKVGSYQLQVVATDSTGLSSPPARFYRLVLPQPRIFAVEPAVVAPGVPVDFYVVGQCFPTNAELRIKGLPQSGTIYQSSTTLVQPSFTPDVAGDYQFDLVVGGVVVSSFTVVCADAAVSPELVLQGPPEEPPAAPRRPVGRITFKAKEGATLARGLMDEIRENDNVVFDIQEGKKGLNAVNVKLARTAGGGEELPKESLEFNYGSARGGKITKSRSNIQNNRMTGGVQPFSGEVQLAEVDFAIPGRGLDFVWARTYRSRPGNQGVINFTVTRWTHSYDVAAAQTAAGIAVADGTGRLDTFKLQTNGTYTCPQFFREGTISNNTFTLTFADTGRWVFNPFDSSLAAGKLRQIITRNGDTMTLGYDTSGRLVQIVDDLDRTNTIAYNTSGQLASVTDFSGRIVRYEYDGNGDLVVCVSPPVTGTPNGNDFPGGKTNRYTYSSGYLDDRENHLLLSVIDAKGQIQHEHVYQHNQTDLEFLRCISVQHWTNTPTIFTYLPQTAAPSNQFATLRCIVNAPGGEVTECFFDARGRCVRQGEFTGYATPGVPVTDTVNRPTGKRRQEDVDVWWRTWQWNSDSLCTSEVLPDGERAQMIYRQEFGQVNPRKKADLMVVHEYPCCNGADTDGDGTSDLTERVWRYEYDPRFGSDLGASRRLRSGVIAEVGAGRPATVGRESAVKPGGGTTMGKGMYSWIQASWDRIAPDGNGVAIKTKGTGADANRSLAGGDDADRDLWPSAFVTSMTDPRGNVMTGSYDAKGNRVKVKFYWDRQSSADLDFSYNAAGQLTAITNAPDANGHRRVDVIEYYSSGPQAGRRKVEIVDVVSDATDDPVAARTSYEYDPRGNLTRIVDPRTNDWLYTYNALDQLVQTKSALLGGGGGGGWRIRTQFSYDANDNLTLVAEENLDATGTSGTNPFWRTQFVYDGGQRLTGCWRDKNGALVLRCTEVKYDAADRVVLYRSPEAVNGHDPLNTVALEYDERGFDYRMIAAPGSSVQSTTQCDYDANGNVTRVSEGLEGTPSIMTMEYDGFAGCGVGGGKAQGAMGAKAKAWMVNNFEVHPVFGMKGLAWVETVWNKQCVEKDTTVRLAKITDPMGNVTTFNYDANDNLKVVRDFGQLNDAPGTNGNIRLAESRYEYDGLDRLVRARDSFFSLPSQTPIGDGERTTTFAYAPNGQCLAMTNDLGNSTTYDYDTAGRVYLVKTPRTVVQSSTVQVQRDAVGNIIQTTQTDQSDLGGPPQVFSWTSIFDEMNRCLSTADNVGNTNLFAYDSRGNCVKATDPKGNETIYAYDGLSRGLSFTASQGAAASGIVVSSGQFDYDDNDRCISSTDANGNVTLHAYDSLDRLTQTTQADGTHTALVWSPRSNLIQETDANGTVITHTYDLNDRCISNHITPGAGVAATTTFETFAYDGCSRLVAATNDVSHSEFDYDSHGNDRGNHTDGWNVLSAYDSVGRRTSLTYPGGRVLTYAYDALDQCTNIVESGASLASFAYDGPGRVARVAYGNGMRTRIFYDGISGTPNAPGDFGQGQVSRILHAMNGGSPQISEIKLAWDPNGNKIHRDDAIFQPAIPRTNTMLLDYDAADRLTEAAVLRGSTLLRDTVYGLDRMGNRTNVTGAASCSGSYVMDALVPGPLDFQMNQYTATPCDTRSYDDNGNLVSRSSPVTGPTTCQYDYADRLVQVQAVDFSSGSMVITTSTYAYDALGRRISKTVSSGGLPPVATQFLYDGGSVIEERSGGVTTVTYGRAFYIGSNEVFNKRSSGQDYFFHTDDQGNVLALTGANGAVVERYDYDDYGKVTFLTSDGIPTSGTSSTVGNPYCWNGLRLDSETGLQNNDGGDYFDPQSGRYTVRGYPSHARSDTYISCDAVNPWSGGASAYRNVPRYIVKADGIVYDRSAWSGGSGSPSAMEKGTVKFFNEAKGFGMVAGGGGGGGVMFNPREYTISKLKEEGGRHTPFHNKYRPQSRIFTTVSNVLKTKHDTAKNSIGNIR